MVSVWNFVLILMEGRVRLFTDNHVSGNGVSYTEES